MRRRTPVRRAPGWLRAPTALHAPVWLRTAISALALVTVGAGVAVAGSHGGYPARQHRLGSGAAWLASDAVGQLALLDGSSAEVAAQVQVAERGQRLAVTQVSSTGYAVNQATGTIRRVDGATFDVTAPATPIPNAGAGLQAYASTDALYVTDTVRGVLVAADPRTLVGRGGIRTVATEIKPDDAAVDGDGRLWFLDRARGDLAWVDGSHSRTRRAAATPGAGRLVIAGGSPVLVDVTRRTAARLDTETGAARSTTDLNVSTSDLLRVSGSPNQDRVYAVTEHGVFVACALSAHECTSALPLAAAGQFEAGAPVESGDRVFIPDYASGRVWIVDLTGTRVTAQPKVLDPGVRFQLTMRDGVVFYNDPASERAGVIRIDGGTVAIRKYDPSSPTKGITGGIRPSATSTPSGARPSASAGHPASSQPTTATSRPSTASRSTSPSPTTSSRSTPTGPPSTTSPPTTPPQTTSSSTAPPSPLSVQIVASKSAAMAGDTVTFRAAVSGASGQSTVAWSFGDGTTGAGTDTTHSWSKAGTYQVSVQVTAPDGRKATASATIRVTAVLYSGSTSLKGTWALDLETGTQEGQESTSDVWWEQIDTTARQLVPWNGATIAHLGQPAFDQVTFATLLATTYSTTPINGSNTSANRLTPGSVIAVLTGSGHYAKVQIVSYGYNLDVRWVVYQ